MAARPPMLLLLLLLLFLLLAMEQCVGLESCAAGYYGSSSSSSSSACTACPVGTYSDYVGEKESCTDCPAGTYGSSTGSTTSTCTDFCDAGEYSAPGASTCTSCSAGYYQSSTGSTSCDACPAGHYQDFTGQTSCPPCPQNTYSPHSAALECTACPDGERAPEGASVCLACSAGEWPDFHVTESCYQCAFDFQCPDGVSCYEGHSGYACSVCEEGYFLMNDRCTECPEWGRYAMIPAVLLAALGCWLLYRMADITSEEERAHRDDEAERSNKDADDENGDQEINAKWWRRRVKKIIPSSYSKVCMAITHFQLTSLFLEFNLEYPPIVLRACEWISWFSLDFMDMSSLECSTSHIGYSERWWLSAALPFMALLPFVVIFALSEYKDAKHREEREKLEDKGERQIEAIARANESLRAQAEQRFREENIENFKNFNEERKSGDRAVRTAMVLLVITYVFSTRTALLAWDCVDNGLNEWQLASHPGIFCSGSDQRWQGMMAGSFFLFF